MEAGLKFSQILWLCRAHAARTYMHWGQRVHWPARRQQTLTNLASANLRGCRVREIDAARSLGVSAAVVGANSLSTMQKQGNPGTWELEQSLPTVGGWKQGSKRRSSPLINLTTDKCC